MEAQPDAMAMSDITKPGQRQEIADASRWRESPAAGEPRVAVDAPPPVAESLGRGRREPAEGGPDAAGNVDTSLRERIRRLSAARTEALRERDMAHVEPRREARAEPEYDDRYEPRPAPRARREEAEPAMRGVARRDAERESDDFDPRQPARRRQPGPEADPEFRAPARRRAAPPEPAATRVDPLEDEMDELHDEVSRLRQEVARLREEVARRPAGGAGELGPLERALQKLAERMDRIDGGPRPAVDDGRPRKPGRGFLGLFGR
ncbi:hypothetical protein CVT23_05755 [Minwuia thermotolerans]|uniref:Uncharacterized protein n=2 Tax=Minwuia thermotolerans TaxID=2056226 RepID=A0A2M9G4Q7_9PROT|nr:hypothetical protein CVT23_05755 [Minwuia thermotolerans]